MQSFPRVSVWVVGLLVGCGGSGPGSESVTPMPTARGTPNGSPVSATLGAAGGELTSDDGVLTLTVPPGALSGDVDIAVVSVTNELRGGFANAYRLTPDGQVFAMPVELAFRYDEAELAGSAPELIDIAVQDAEGYWRPLAEAVTLDGDARLVIARTDHFSDFSQLLGAQIRPAEATVRVDESVDLAARYCALHEIGGDPDDLGFLCLGDDEDDELAPLGTFRDWAVNGVTGGNPELGTLVVESPGMAATYRAPSEIPADNPVAVSVLYSTAAQSFTLVSNITVTIGEQWVGEATATNFNGTTHASLTWVLSSTDQMLQRYRPSSGTVSFTIAPETIPPECSATISPSNQPITSQDGELVISLATLRHTFEANGANGWMATLNLSCPPPQGDSSGPTFVGGSWLANSGQVSEDGMTISGNVTQGDTHYVFQFMKRP